MGDVFSTGNAFHDGLDPVNAVFIDQLAGIGPADMVGGVVCQGFDPGTQALDLLFLGGIR